MMGFILQREVSRWRENDDIYSGTVLVSEYVCQEEYVATLLEVIRNCEKKLALAGDDLQGEICILNYMSKAKTHLHKIESGEYKDSMLVFII